MNITGRIYSLRSDGDRLLLYVDTENDGAFRQSGWTANYTVPKIKEEGYTSSISFYTFDASKSWTGVIFIQIPSHTHSRGSMNITGDLYGLQAMGSDLANSLGGDERLFRRVIFGNPRSAVIQLHDSLSDYYIRMIFDASKNWTGKY